MYGLASGRGLARGGRNELLDPREQRERGVIEIRAPRHNGDPQARARIRKNSAAVRRVRSPCHAHTTHTVSTTVRRTTPVRRVRARTLHTECGRSSWKILFVVPAHFPKMNMCVCDAMSTRVLPSALHSRTTRRHPILAPTFVWQSLLIYKHTHTHTYIRRRDYFKIVAYSPRFFHRRSNNPPSPIDLHAFLCNISASYPGDSPTSAYRVLALFRVHSSR